jgi:glycosyltransferase involved in cell wall biosynthesis
MPRVSVIVPTHNRRDSLARALRSIDAQHFRDFEIVVIDDGSSDGTAEWLQANRPSASLIHLSPSAGAAAARNRGIQNATGDIIAFLDDDDMWHAAYLQSQIMQFDAHPEADLCTTAHVEIDASGTVSHPELRPLQHHAQPLLYLLAESPIHTLSVVACRRSAFERIGLFDESLSIVHDLDWYLRLVASGGKMQHSPIALVERSVPGGLVTHHRAWFAEERSVHQRAFATNRITPGHRRMIRASRALLFARIALMKGDLPFSMARFAEAFLLSPNASLRIAILRLLRLRFSTPG